MNISRKGEKIAKKCLLCGKGFSVHPYRKNTAQFCSGKCQRENNRIIHRGKKHPLFGRPRSLETKKKISDSLKGEKNPGFGKHLSEETRKKISISQQGKIVSEATREKISKSHKGKPATWQKGEKNPNWKGGTSPLDKLIRTSLEYITWRETVFARDNWTCKKCNTRGGKLHAHHIRNFSSNIELRFVEANGITFCDGCHNFFHKTFGKKNNNEQQVGEFLSQIPCLTSPIPA